MSSPYTKHVDYRFEVDDVGLAIRPFKHKQRSCVEVEETRKNGQEDCHMGGLLVKDSDGTWQWDEGRNSFDEQMGSDFADAIAAFLNANTPPDA